MRTILIGGLIMKMRLIVPEIDKAEEIVEVCRCKSGFFAYNGMAIHQLICERCRYCSDRSTVIDNHQEMQAGAALMG